VKVRQVYSIGHRPDCGTLTGVRMAGSYLAIGRQPAVRALGVIGCRTWMRGRPVLRHPVGSVRPSSRRSCWATSCLRRAKGPPRRGIRHARRRLPNLRPSRTNYRPYGRRRLRTRAQHRRPPSCTARDNSTARRRSATVGGIVAEERPDMKVVSGIGSVRPAVRRATPRMPLRRSRRWGGMAVTARDARTRPQPTADPPDDRTRTPPSATRSTRRGDVVGSVIRPLLRPTEYGVGGERGPTIRVECVNARIKGLRARRPPRPQQRRGRGLESCSRYRFHRRAGQSRGVGPRRVLLRTKRAAALLRLQAVAAQQVPIARPMRASEAPSAAQWTTAIVANDQRGPRAGRSAAQPAPSRLTAALETET